VDRLFALKTFSGDNIIIIDSTSSSIDKIDNAFAWIPTNLKNGIKRDEYDLKMFYLNDFVPSNSSLPSLRYCPCDIVSLPPDQAPSRDGEVYGRQYTHKKDIVVEHTDIDQNDANGKFWLNLADTLKSITIIPSNDQYPDLMPESDISIPDALRQKMMELVDNIMKLDNGYFSMVYQQFKQFMDVLVGELSRSIDMEHIKDLCRFKFNNTVTFNGRTWKMLNPIPPPLNSTYKSCLDAFDLHLWKQFCDDFMRVDDLTVYDDRDYKHILLPDYYDQYQSKI